MNLYSSSVQPGPNVHNRRALQWRSPGTLAVASIALVIGIAGCTGSGSTNAAPTNVLYVSTNDPAVGRNAILAYRRAADGSLAQFSGSPFLTGGTGVTNPTQLDGPDDDDQNVIVSADHRFLFAVNGGSNTIAAFQINSDGSLTAAPGSPFPSGGIEPASLGISGRQLYVVNKDQDPGQVPLAGGTNYVAFRINSNGSLSPLPGSTVEAPLAASSSQALISRDGKFLFDAEEGVSALRVFSIGTNGLLTEAPGSPHTPPSVNGTPASPLGLMTHPTLNLLYSGFVNVNQLAVYSFDPTTGTPTFLTSVPNTGVEICWLVVTRDGKHLYSASVGSSTISHYDLTDPRNPVERQHVAVTNAASGGTFQLSLDPSERLLYVVQQRTTTNSADLNGNAIHVFQIAADGSVSEAAFSPIALPVPSNAHPQGIVVL